MSFTNPQELGRPLTIKDEGVDLDTNVESIDYVGSGITGTNSGSAVTATVGLGAGLSFVDEETPTGSINNANKE